MGSASTAAVAGDIAYLAKDPACAIAYWGIASLLMWNPLSGVGPVPKDAEKAQAMIELARQIPTTPREHAYIEVVGATTGTANGLTAPARMPAPAVAGARRPAIRTMTKLRYSARSILRARNRKPIRPGAAYCIAIPEKLPTNIPITPGSRTISYIHTDACLATGPAAARLCQNAPDAPQRDRPHLTR